MNGSPLQGTQQGNQPSKSKPPVIPKATTNRRLFVIGFVLMTVAIVIWLLLPALFKQIPFQSVNGMAFAGIFIFIGGWLISGASAQWNLNTPPRLMIFCLTCEVNSSSQRELLIAPYNVLTHTGMHGEPKLTDVLHAVNHLHALLPNN